MKIAIVLLALVSTACGYKILCLQTVPSKSHFSLMMGLVAPLLDDGHEITLVTTYPEFKIPKQVKIIDVSHIEQLVTQMSQLNRTQQGIDIVKEFGRNISLGAIESPAVRNILVNQQFDAVISEWFFSELESGYAAIQQVPWIMLSGMVMHTHLEFFVDQVRSVSTIPAINNKASIPMTFFQRFTNTIQFFYWNFIFWKDYPLLISDYESQFNPLAQARGVPLPPLSSALHNISILFVNSHPSFAPAQSLPPNVIDIAGYHISPNTSPLPKDLQNLLDSSPQGVIYFSMGSVVKSTELPEYTHKNIIQVFKELPYTVLWKFDGKLENLPKNVHIRSWMPQSAILAHPHVKVFITHGGLLSKLESLQFGVPLIAVPVFGDQPSNAKRCEHAGHGLIVKYGAKMDVELKEKLNIILNNDSYYKKAKYLSNLFVNRPVSTTKLIQHYVKLAIESKGAYHLRSKTHLHAWYELWMLDQVAFLLLIIYLIYIVIIKLLKFISKPSSSKKTIKEKKKKH